MIPRTLGNLSVGGVDVDFLLLVPEEDVFRTFTRSLVDELRVLPDKIFDR